jgi:hypothetical protein
MGPCVSRPVVLEEPRKSPGNATYYDYVTDGVLMNAKLNMNKHNSMSWSDCQVRRRRKAQVLFELEEKYAHLREEKIVEEAKVPTVESSNGQEDGARMPINESKSYGASPPDTPSPVLPGSRAPQQNVEKATVRRTLVRKKSTAVPVENVENIFKSSK